MAHTVRVFLEYVHHQTGHWCNRCIRSTGMQVWVAVHAAGRMTLQTRLHCYECRGADVTLEHGAV